MPPGVACDNSRVTACRGEAGRLEQGEVGVRDLIKALAVGRRVVTAEERGEPVVVAQPGCGMGTGRSHVRRVMQHGVRQPEPLHDDERGCEQQQDASTSSGAGRAVHFVACRG